MPETNVYFTRHAEPDLSNHDDLTRALTDKGMRDRLLVTAYLAERHIDAVYSSPFRRAYDTVADFAEKAGLSITTVDDFRERQLANVWVTDFIAFCEQQWADFSYKRPGGECLAEVEERNIRALQQILTQHSGENIVIGSHGTAIATVLHHYNPAFGYADFLRIRNKMPWIVRLTFAEYTLTAVEKIDLLP